MVVMSVGAVVVSMVDELVTTTVALLVVKPAERSDKE